MFGLAQGLAAAKSRQDVPAALEFLHPDMALESPFGQRCVGISENEKALKRFFASFPDYHVALHGCASNGHTLVIAFTFRDNLIASERSFFDLSVLCAQSGVSTDAVRRKLFGEAAQPALP